jgi:hypothetical protein
VQYPRLSSLAFLAWVAAVILFRGAVFIVLSKSATGFVCLALDFCIISAALANHTQHQPYQAQLRTYAEQTSCRIEEMQGRLDRLQDRASKHRQIAKDVMVELDLKKVVAPDFTASVRPGMPALMVIDEATVPGIYREPRLNRQGLVADLKQGAEITGVALSNPKPVLSVRTK